MCVGMYVKIKKKEPMHELVNVTARTQFQEKMYYNRLRCFPCVTLNVTANVRAI